MTVFKKNKKIIPVAILGSVIFFSGCEAVSNREMGAGLGSVAGGIIGNQIGSGSGRYAATALGALVGSWIGVSIGHELDKKVSYRYNDNYDVEGESYNYQNQQVTVTGQTYEVDTTAIDGRRLVIMDNGMVYDPSSKRILGYVSGNQYQQKSHIDRYNQSKDEQIEQGGWEGR